jgi:hypothetical protein
VSNLIRWHWRVTDRTADPAVTHELQLDALHLDADEDRFPYVECHHLTLRWRDAFYPPGLKLGETADRFVTQDNFRYELREHIAGPFWTQPVFDGLTVTVQVARPMLIYGDDVSSEKAAFRVGYEYGGRKWWVARVSPATPGFSKLLAAD